MGIDISIYAEKKRQNKWEFFMPQKNFNDVGYCEPLDIGGRIPALFQILSRLYEDKYYGKNFKYISDNRGIPADSCEEIKYYLEDEYRCSYVYLNEILEFEWNAESKEYGIYKEIVGEQFFDNVVTYLQSALQDGVTEKDIRIVFGYNS